MPCSLLQGGSFMDKEALIKKLEEYGLNTKEAYMAEAFSRNIGLLTRGEQEQLANARVAIPGMGGVGGVHLITLVRTGVGRFHLSDFDAFEPANVNRQFGARIPDFGRSKLEVMVEEALSINPYLGIKMFPEGIDRTNVDEFLDGVQVVLDGLDFFNFDTRRLLFNRAREKGTYVITAGPMGFSAAVLIFSPHEGMSFDEYFNVIEGMTPQEEYLSYGLGLAPRATHIKYMDLSRVDLESRAGPSLNIACQICSGIAATEAVRIILKKGGVKPVPYFFQFDPYVQKYRKGKLYWGNRNPVQRMKMNVVRVLLRKNKQQYKPSPPEFPRAKVTDGSVPEEVVSYVIRAGIQAPSGDNAQPWKFSYKGNTICLYLDRDADHSFFNINQLASVISCGAVLENMRVAATAFGLEAEIDYLPSAGKDDLMAFMKLVYSGVRTDALFESIWRRRTNRKFYEKRALPPSVLDDLRKATGDRYPGVRLHFITDRSDLREAARMIYNVDRIRTEHRPLHEHLCRMIRYSHEEAMEKRDGLPLKNLEAGPAGELFLKVTRPWWLMNLMNRIGVGRLVAFHSYQGILHASGVGVLTVPGMKTEDFLKGGQALERLWLTLTHKGLAVQPMTAITLFWLRWQLEGQENFSRRHRRLLRDVWAEYRRLFPEMDFSKEWHVLLFRFGYWEEVKYGTLRKNVESFLR
jgi:molybdopterin/thiamine biosynthesis adenylyltransferase